MLITINALLPILGTGFCLYYVTDDKGLAALAMNIMWFIVMCINFAKRG